MSEQSIYLDLYERIIYNVPAKKIELNSIGDLTVLEILEYYAEQLQEAMERLKYDRAIKRFRVYGSTLHLYLE